jgi:hypothetical protein
MALTIAQVSGVHRKTAGNSSPRSCKRCRPRHVDDSPPSPQADMTTRASAHGGGARLASDTFSPVEPPPAVHRPDMVAGTGMTVMFSAVCT